MAKHFDAIIESLNEALANGNIERYEEIKETFGVQELWEQDLEKELNYKNLIGE